MASVEAGWTVVERVSGLIVRGLVVMSAGSCFGDFWNDLACG